jgi:hypothetical protein
VLPLATAAGTEVRARRVNAQQRGFEDRRYLAAKEILTLLGDADYGLLTLYAGPRENSYALRIYAANSITAVGHIGEAQCNF